ncbi:hypothetical protein [Krasilnikovia sp. MM14-A1259]|uniref:hypothetical protein n=1 Tax=Krasilnikovia sp. MM14-A1259 TaxID=3373539 RepID=UPI00399C9E0A
MAAWDLAWERASPEIRSKFIGELQDELRAREDKLDASSKELAHQDCSAATLTRVVGYAVGAVGLTHDIGHAPFSHALEPFYEDNIAAIADPATLTSWQKYQEDVGIGEPQFHEFAGKTILDRLLARQNSNELPRYLIARIFAARGKAPFDWAACLHGLLDSEFDVDRLDYLQRDAGRAGTEFSAIDSGRLLNLLELHWTDEWGWVFGLDLRARSAMETFLFQRVQAYVWMYLHSGVVASNAFLVRAVEALWRLSNDESLPASLRAEFGGGRPQFLDYVTSANAGAPSHFIDDHSIYSWIKSGQIAARRNVDSHDGTGDVREFQIAQVLCEESLYHEPRYVPLWRTFDEQARLCSTFADRGISLATFAERWGDRPSSHALRGSASRDTLCGAALDFNKIVQAHNGGIRLLEEILNKQAPVVGPLGQGKWVLSFAKLQPVSPKQKSIHLFNGPTPVRMTDVSPVVRGLTDLCNQRIKLHVYFLLNSETRFHKEGVRKQAGYHLHEPFQKAFKNWLEIIA